MPDIKLRSIDGTTFWIAGDSLTDYVLHPVFLRFLALAILTFALLDQRPAFQSLGGWELTFLWFVVSSVVLGLIVLAAAALSALSAKGHVRQVYTPVLVVPLVLCSELALQLSVLLLDGPGNADFAQLLRYSARDLVLAGLFDLMHAHFVVYAHPLATREIASTAQPVTAPPEAAQFGNIRPIPDEPDAAAQPDSRPEPAVPEISTVQIGPTQLPLGSILLIRTEDHYLGVTTRTGKALHRAKMADIPELHAGLVGMQINRSVWIAYSAVAEVAETENRQVVVTLVTGDEERVSKPRVFAFRQSYGKYLAGRSAQS